MLVGTIVNHSMFYFVDGFDSYNQIKMDLLDAEKNAFPTPMGNFHYLVMSFGLKYVDPTYQCAMPTLFHDMRHDCLEDYGDAIIVKSRKARDHVDNVRKVFVRCKQYSLKMNLLKWFFWYFFWKNLRLTIQRKGIDFDPTKAKVIQDIEHPTTCKQLKTLLGEFTTIQIPSNPGWAPWVHELLKTNIPFPWSKE